MQIVTTLKKILKRDHTYTASETIQWFGTEYGGFFLDQSLLNSTATSLSFGVGEDVSFDLALSKKGIQRVFLFDPTPKSAAFIKRSQLPGNFSFLPVGISDQDENARFYLPKDENNVSGSLAVHKRVDTGKVIDVDLKKLSTILRELNISSVDVLKMDIEGSEYRVLKNIMMEQIFPVQICVEFHNNFFRNGKQLFGETLALLAEHGYETAGISRSGNEYLFLKKTSLKNY